MDLIAWLVAACTGIASASIAAFIVYTRIAPKVKDLEQANALSEQANQTLTTEKDGLATQLETANQAIQAHATQITELSTQLSAQAATLTEKEQALAEHTEKSEALDSQLRTLSEQRATLETTLEQERKHTQEKLDQLEENKQVLKQEFSQLSQEIFEHKQKQFTEQSQQNLQQLLNPFKEQLDGFKKKVEDVHLNDTRERAELKTELSHLHQLNKQITQEAANLTKALKGDNKTQGNWGELLLEKVLEMSGLRKDSEYKLEVFHRNEDNDGLRPDAVIYLPDSRHIIIDSKVSLVSYNNYINAETEAEQEAALKAHLLSVKQHVKGLSSKNYPALDELNSPDFVFMFMPVEPAFTLAFSQDEQLFSTAFDNRIIIVTPTTLLASLRTVANIWSIERQNKNAKDIASRGALMYDKMATVLESLEKLGNQLSTMQKTYDTTINSFNKGRGNLVDQALKLKNLGVKPKKDLPQKIVEATEQATDLIE